MEFLSDLPFINESLSWDGRVWIESNPVLIDERGSPKIRVISYRLVSDFHSSSMSHSIDRSWDLRSKAILNEILSYNPDILCLQEVDHFKDFWFSNLSINGYDSFFLNRTQEKDYHHEGILLAYKRSKFKLIRSYDVELNSAVKDNSLGAVFKESCRTDDVAQIYFLHTKDKSNVPTGLCIVNIMTTEHIRSQEIRLAHLRYITREVEKYNKEFQFPVVLCINLNDTPASMGYTLLTTGREPLSAKVPLACTRVKAESTCRGSALVKWYPPKTSIADPPLLYYRIAYRPGGSSILGFRSQIEISSGDCIKYVEFYDPKNRIKKIVAQEELQFTVPGLCAEVPYEFRVCAINEMGEGVWSDISDPIILPNPEKAPQMPELENFKSLTIVKEEREIEKMKHLDYNANIIIKADPVNSTTQLTPRRVDGEINNYISQGKVLPYYINPRVGWKESLHGSRDPVLLKELNREIVLGRSQIRGKEGFINPSWNYYQDQCIRSAFQDNNIITPYIEGKDGSTLILDAKEVLNKLGEPNKRHVHSLMFRSAYESSSPSGEPIHTSCFPSISIYEKADCHDYIFYSSCGLLASKILSIPTFSNMRKGEFSECKQTYPEIFYMNHFCKYQLFFNNALFLSNFEQSSKGSKKLPRQQKHSRSDIQAAKSRIKEKLKKTREILGKGLSLKLQANEIFWGGNWSPFPIIDNCKYNHYIPNSRLGSTHIALGVDLVIDTNLLPSALYSRGK